MELHTGRLYMCECFDIVMLTTNQSIYTHNFIEDVEDLLLPAQTETDNMVSRWCE